MEEDPLPKPEYEHPTRDVMIILAVFFEFGLAPFSLTAGLVAGSSAAADIPLGCERRRLGNSRHNTHDIDVRRHAHGGRSARSPE